LLCFFLKNLIPWRDSNPGLLPLRLMQCPLRHTAGQFFKRGPGRNVVATQLELCIYFFHRLDNRVLKMLF
jgi:hypothetical protein